MLRLKEKEHLIDNIWAFRFEPSEPLVWTAGQFIRVKLPHDNPDAEGIKRWFTVSSAPYEGIVQISTRVTNSTFKQALAAIPIGGELEMIEPPDGNFVWEESDKPLVFVAGGIGITPFRSILKQRAHNAQPLNVSLVYGGRTEALPFRDELEAWIKLDSRLRVHYVIGESLTPAKLIELLPGLKESLVYVSGPEPMVQSLTAELKTAGVLEEQLRRDEFPNYTEANY